MLTQLAAATQQQERQEPKARNPPKPMFLDRAYIDPTVSTSQKSQAGKA